MKTRTLKIGPLLGLLALVFLNTSCGADKNGHKEDPAEPRPPGDIEGQTETTNTETTTETARNENQVAIANPASSHCVKSGGKLKIRKDKTGGEFGVCEFKDGSRCEEWKFFHRQCAPGECREPSGICKKR